MRLHLVNPASEDVLGRGNLARVLSDFVESHFQAVSDLHLYCNFLCHVTTMQQAGLIAQDLYIDFACQLDKSYLDSYG